MLTLQMQLMMGLLQWAWDSETTFDDDQREKNLKHLGIKLNVSSEDMIVKNDFPGITKWK